MRVKMRKEEETILDSSRASSWRKNVGPLLEALVWPWAHTLKHCEVWQRESVERRLDETVAADRSGAIAAAAAVTAAAEVAPAADAAADAARRRRRLREGRRR